jgi:hypothetical protein
MNTNKASAGPPGREALAAAVIVPCTRRKFVRASDDGMAVSLPSGSQRQVETAWQELLRKLTPACPAGSLYAGRGFQLAREAATNARCKLFIISAGLGVIPATRLVPAYGLTIVGDGPESVRPKINGRLDPAAWWRVASVGPFAVDIRESFSERTDLPVLLSLTRPYAQLVSSAIESLPDTALDRLRIFGAGLGRVLPGRVTSQIIPYDARLDAVMPGTKSDFSQRALLHFVSLGLPSLPNANVDEHRAWVNDILAGQSAPFTSARKRSSDEYLMDVIQRHLRETQSVSKLLRIVRDREGIACEQSRFRKLYDVALERSAT